MTTLSSIATTELIFFFEVPWFVLLTSTISALALLTAGVLTTVLLVLALLATASW